MGAPLVSLRRGAVSLLVLLAVAGCGGGGDDPGPSTKAQATTAVAMLKGIPQAGARLGAANAPAKLTLYTSLTELNTAFVRSDLPKLLTRFVKPGLLQIDLVTVDRDTTVEDPSGSRQLARVAQSAGRSDHLWDFYVAFETYYDGTYTPGQARSALERISGITPDDVLKDARSKDVSTLVQAARKEGAKVPGVLPSFMLRGPNGASQSIGGDCLDCLTPRVARALGDTPAAPLTSGADAKVKANLRSIQGLPQDGITLGKLRAPATLSIYLVPGPATEALFARELPTIVRRWVRPGRLRVQIRFEPPRGRADAKSATAASRLATSAGVDDHLWNFLAALGARTAGKPLGPKVLSAALGDVSGIDVAKVRSRAGSADVIGAIARGVGRAREIGVKKVPAFVFDSRTANNERLDGSCPDCLIRSIAKALAAKPKPKPKAQPKRKSTPAPVVVRAPAATARPVTPVRTATPRPAPARTRVPTPATPQPTSPPKIPPKPQKTPPPKIPIKP